MTPSATSHLFVLGLGFADRQRRECGHGEAITVTKHGRPVARIISAATPPHLAALIADGTVRPPEGPRYLPAKPARLKGTGKSAAEYVSEGRR